MNVAVDLSVLADRVAPLVLARERTLPVAESFVELFPDGGLIRGHTVACTGSAATSLALALVAPAVAGGAWLALVDVPTIGLDAASEFGVPLERVVAIDTGERSRWPDVIAAAADGFDLLLVRIPPDIAPATMRKVTTRLRQRDVVMVVLGDHAGLTCDAELGGDSVEWVGMGDGHGHLRQRELVVHTSGRRLAGTRRCRLELPARAS